MNPRFIYILAALVFLGLTGCGSDSKSTPTPGFGELTVSLTDAPSPEYKAVYISINQVEVNRSADDEENGWQVVDFIGETINPLEYIGKTINLLEYTGKNTFPLGTRNLPAGEYNQLRLRLADAPDDEQNLNGNDHLFANYVIDTADNVYELKVPSGYQSGIKLVKKFTIESLGHTALILDFDAMKSVVEAGKSGQWILKPVIKVLDTATLADIDGSVTDTADDSAVTSARVTAQTYNGFALDPKDEITVHAGTLTNVNTTDNPGDYLLRVPEGNYTIVAYKEGFRPECRRVSTTGETTTADFALTASSSGTLEVAINGLTEADDSVTVSVRRSDFCGGTLSTLYEMTSHSFAANEAFDISLPPGEYTVVAYGDNLTTVVGTRTITSGETKYFTVSL